MVVLCPAIAPISLLLFVWKRIIKTSSSAPRSIFCSAGRPTDWTISPRTVQIIILSQSFGPQRDPHQSCFMWRLALPESVRGNNPSNKKPHNMATTCPFRDNESGFSSVQNPCRHGYWFEIGLSCNSVNMRWNGIRGHDLGFLYQYLGVISVAMVWWNRICNYTA